LAAENHSEQVNESEADVPPAIPSRPEHTKSKVLSGVTASLVLFRLWAILLNSASTLGSS